MDCLLEKNCFRCKTTKPVSEFYHNTKRNEPQCYCKACHIQVSMECNRKKPLVVKFTQAKVRDKRRGFKTCTREEWMTFLGSATECNYCGETFPLGLDRKDNTRGHTIDNCVPCCYSCNVTRGDRFTYEEMLKVLGPALRKIREQRLSQLQLQ